MYNIVDAISFFLESNAETRGLGHIKGTNGRELELYY